MDSGARQGARRSHGGYGEDEQRRIAPKDTGIVDGACGTAHQAVDLLFHHPAGQQRGDFIGRQHFVVAWSALAKGRVIDRTSRAFRK
jgi:hypothetical protein